jgi:hypothetical protein
MENVQVTRENRLLVILTRFYFVDFCGSEFFNSHAWFQQLSVNSQVLGGPFLLLQLRVLRLGFFQDGDVGIGVFP